MSRSRILVVSDAGSPTGLARVTSAILSGIKDNFDIVQLGTNYFGDPHDAPWPVYPAHLRGDGYGVNRLPEMLREFNPDLIFLYNDLWVVASYMNSIRLHAPHAAVVVYCPIDGGPVDSEYIEQLDGVAKFVVCTEYAAHMVNSAAKIARSLDQDLRFPTADIIPHPLDPSFYPIASLEEQSLTKRSLAARRALLPQFDNPEDLFIVLNANRNQGRKRIDITLEAFAKFAEDKPDTVKLYLHMGSKDGGWDIPKLAKREKVESRILMSSLQEHLVSIPSDQLNTIYNACDIGINTSTSEGWGLTSFEHAATGAAQIVPNHTATKELWKGCALCIEPVLELTSPITNTKAWLLPIEDVVDALNKMYYDNDLRQSLAARAMSMARDSRLSVETVATQWRTLFEEVDNSEERITLGSACCQPAWN